MLKYFRGKKEIASMPKKHANFCLDITLSIEIVMVLYRNMLS